MKWPNMYGIYAQTVKVILLTELTVLAFVVTYEALARMFGG